jgi:hypothetical protein
VERRAQVGHEVAQELVQLGLVDGHGANLLGEGLVDGTMVAPGLAPRLRRWPPAAAIDTIAAWGSRSTSACTCWACSPSP